MNVRCPHCQSVFRVDPERVPAAGVKARCSRCSNVFELSKDGAARVPVAAAPPVAAPSAPAPAPAPAAPPRPVAPPAPPPVAAAPPQPAQPITPRPIPTTPPPMATPAPAAADATRVATPAASAAPVKRASFRNQDPGARAQRLARALVSDIVAYNKDKLKQIAGADAATFRTEFREEIRKSWEEYVEQVGLDLAKSTPYFRDSLNEILAKGQKVF